MVNGPGPQARRYRDRMWVYANSLPAGWKLAEPARWPVDHAILEQTNPKARYAELVVLMTRHPGYWCAYDLSQHGTWNGYNNWYCRCPACTLANLLRQNEKNAARRDNVHD